VLYTYPFGTAGLRQRRGLPYRIAGAVRLAAERRVPARIGSGRGTGTIAVNRRQVVGAGQTILGEHPEGPIDRAVELLRIESMDGAPCAIVVNYACHPVILGPESLQVSADWVGYARAMVEDASGCPMLFIQGACGDINPLGGVQSDYRNCERLGATLANEILDVWDATRADADDVRVAAVGQTLHLGTAPVEHSTLPPTSPRIDDARLDAEFPWASEGDAGGVHAAIQGIAVGDIALLGLACEPFAQTGLEIKRRSPYAHTLVAGYANGCVGYVCPADAFEHGGYEVQTAHRFYRLPEPFEPRAEHQLAGAAVDVLHQMRDNSP
jgi:neutral ceramidase